MKTTVSKFPTAYTFQGGTGFAPLPPRKGEGHLSVFEVNQASSKARPGGGVEGDAPAALETRQDPRAPARSGPAGPDL